MDLNSINIIVKQIELTKHEEEVRQSEAKKQAEAEEKITEIERKAQQEEAEKTFNYNKKTIEGSDIREVLEIIVEALNSSDERFSPLKQRVVKKILNNQHYSIREFYPFTVSQPYLFKGNSSYRIDVYFYDQYHIRDSLIYVSCEDLKCITILIVKTDLFQYTGSCNISINKELATQQIVDFLMKVQ